MNKKIFFLLALFVIGVAGAYIVLKPNPKRQANKALEHLQNGNFMQAEALIATLPSALESALYKGYLEQVRGRFDLADRYFTAAWMEAKKTGYPQVLAEISLARATNAYMSGSDEKCVEFIRTARTYTSEALPSLSFFDGLESYLRQAYGEAFHLWNTYSYDRLNSWMSTSIEILFPSAWQKLHLAHCLLEEGEVMKGREILEKECCQATLHSENLPLTNLFLGYSYIKESHKVSCADRSSFYRLAHFYFERAYVSKLYDREKNRIASHVENEAIALLLSDRDAKRDEGLGFVHILQEWDAQMAVDRLSTVLACDILSRKEKENVYLCATIRQQFQGTLFHNLLTDRMLCSLAKELKDGDTENLFYLWSLVEQLSPTPKQAAKQIASLAAVEIFETIKKDDLLLTRTRNFLAFWEKLGRNESERERMARDLLSHAKLFWHNEKEEKKGERLMEIALKITNHDPLIAQEIETFLSNLYAQAENSNMIRRLALVYEAMEYFEINRDGLVSKATIANHLADATYLYDARNYLAAKRHAQWVLKLEPHNDGAHLIAGLSSFQLREYGKAICHLQLVVEIDEESYKILALSRALSSKVQEKHLCQSDIMTWDGID